MPRILLVEDDTELCGLVAKRLEEERYEVETVGTGPAALEAVKRQIPDLVLLDIMLPEMDGLEVCRRLRAVHPLLYIIMLTARAGELDRIVGLEVGADDYLTKPFSLQELVARIRSALRRIRLTREHSQPETGELVEKIDCGDLQIDLRRRQVLLHGVEVHLTVREYDLLVFLASNPDQPFTRSQLLDRIWDIQYEGYDRTVDSHIQRLRAKIEQDLGNPRFIRTVWGVGYKFQPEATEDQ
jgi:DNA-binding response OmpR family regulator